MSRQDRERIGRWPPLWDWLDRSRAAATLVLIGLGAMLGAVEASRPVLPEGVDLYSDIVYRAVGDRRVRLDLYVPVGPAPRRGWPTIVAIHGGGWRGGSRLSYGRMIARLSRHGYVVAAIDYRLSRGGDPSWPENLNDVRSAVRWLRRHAEEYGIDGRRIAAIGASAGGHLAALLGTSADDDLEAATAPVGSTIVESARVSAVIDFYGPSLLADLADRPVAGESVALLLGGRPEAEPERAAAASPALRVTPRAAPMLLVYGDRDPTVPVEQARTLAEALERAGVRHELIVVEGAGHGFGLDGAGRDFTPLILEFLRESWDDAR